MDNRNLPATGSQRPQTQSPRVGGSVEAKAIRVILGQFWVDRDPEVQALEVASWIRVLKGLQPDEILDAWNEYQRVAKKNERGKIEKPSAHDIRQIAMRARQPSGPPLNFHRAKSSIDRPREEERIPVSPEVAERICQEAGFTPDLSKALNRFPMAKSAAAAIEKADSPRETHWTHRATERQLAELERARSQNTLIAQSRGKA